MLLIISDRNDLSLTQLEKDRAYTSFIRTLRYDTFLIEGFETLTISERYQDIKFTLNDESFTLSDFDLVWYKQFSFDQSVCESIIGSDTFEDFYKNELKNLHYYFHHKVYENCKTINSPFKGITNKLIQLEVFVNCGFRIPDTAIYTGNVDLDFNEKQFITKGISIPPQVKIDDKLHVGYTSVIDASQKEYLRQKKYFPTLIQEKIPCQSELRVFFMLNRMYAINILVDRDHFVDYRSTNYSQEYNAFPVKLSEDLEAKIRTVMNALELDSGSLDILINENDECILLEVNKYGQFGMINDISPNYMLKTVIDTILETKLPNCVI